MYPLEGKCFCIESFSLAFFHIITHLILDSPQPKLAAGYPKYTDCIVTVLWADGVMRTPPVLFTYNPKFMKNNITTPRRKAIHTKYLDLLSQFALDDCQIVHLEGSRQYVPESSDLVQQYFTIFPIPPGSVIFSDQGNAFFKDRRPVLLDCGASLTFTYPPVVHQYLSPNDNHHHGSAKAKWRSKIAETGWGKDDSLETSLCLLSFLSHVDSDEISGYFTKNFFLGVSEATAENCVDHITKGHFSTTMKNQYFTHCRRAVEYFEETGIIGYTPPPPHMLREISGTLMVPIGQNISETSFFENVRIFLKFGD